MHEHQPPEGGEQPPRSPEARRPTDPRVYIASLSDYNDGRLHGAWIDADQDVPEIQDAIAGMLSRSPVPGAEEWAIHDYEGFGILRLSEYEDLATVSRLGHGIAEHGLAYAALATIVGTDREVALSRFEDHYHGRYDTLEEFARQLADDLGFEDELQQLPEGLRPYVSIDYQHFARDLGTELHEIESGDGGVFIFDTRL